MPNKVKLNLGGREVWGELVSVRSSQEYWNEYLLDDRSTLKFKTVVTEVYRIEDQHDAEGNPVYFVKSVNVLSVNAPEDLRKKE